MPRVYVENPDMTTTERWLTPDQHTERALICQRAGEHAYLLRDRKQISIKLLASAGAGDPDADANAYTVRNVLARAIVNAMPGGHCPRPKVADVARLLTLDQRRDWLALAGDILAEWRERHLFCAANARYHLPFDAPGAPAPDASLASVRKLYGAGVSAGRAVI